MFEAMFSHDFTSLQTACETANPGSLCSQSVCKTEMTFAIKASANSIAGKSSAEFVHDNGFDPSSDQVCATVRLKMSLKFLKNNKIYTAHFRTMNFMNLFVNF